MWSLGVKVGRLLVSRVGGKWGARESHYNVLRTNQFGIPIIGTAVSVANRPEILQPLFSLNKVHGKVTMTKHLDKSPTKIHVILRKSQDQKEPLPFLVLVRSTCSTSWNASLSNIIVKSLVPGTPLPGTGMAGSADLDRELGKVNSYLII